jgi:hypothetical protein
MAASLTLVLVTDGPARQAAPILAERFPHVRCETGSVLVGIGRPETPESVLAYCRERRIGDHTMKARLITLTALALALAATACTEDATAPSPGAPSARAGAPQSPGRPLPESAGDSYTLYDGPVRYDLNRIVRDGAVTETRILKDGLPFLTVAGDILALSPGEEAPVQLFDEGQIVLDEAMVFSTSGASLQAPQAGLQRVMAYDQQCLEQAMAFLAASAWLGTELYILKHKPWQASWSRIRRAAGLVLATGAALVQCYQANTGG